MTTKRVVWTVYVDIEIADDHVDDIIGRTQTQDWRDNFYNLTPDQAWGMIARCIEYGGFVDIAHMDGWADVTDPSVVRIDHTLWEIEEVRELPSE